MSIHIHIYYNVLFSTQLDSFGVWLLHRKIQFTANSFFIVDLTLVYAVRKESIYITQLKYTIYNIQVRFMYITFPRWLAQLPATYLF